MKTVDPKGPWYIKVTEENAKYVTAWRWSGQGFKSSLELSPDQLAGMCKDGSRITKEHNPASSPKSPNADSRYTFGDEVSFEWFMENVFMADRELVRQFPDAPRFFSTITIPNELMILI